MLIGCKCRDVTCNVSTDNHQPFLPTLKIMEIAKKKNYSKWRAGTLISVYVLFGIHIIHWKIAKSTLAPLELNEVLYTVHQGIVTAGFIFMAITLIATLIFGRFFCSWACHILALQDFSVWLLQKMHIKPMHIKSRAMFLIPIAALFYLFVWPQIVRIYNGVPMPSFRVLTDKDGWASFVTTDYWRNLPSIPIIILTFFAAGFVVVYLLGSRGFCSNVCPYGVVYGLADKIAPGKIKLTGNVNQCAGCTACTAACTSHILVHKEIKEFGKVVNSNCLKDLDCVTACPKDILHFGFTKPSFGKSLPKAERTAYSFTLFEELQLAFFTIAYILIYRGLYDTIPFLLGLGLAVVLGYFTVMFIRLFTTEYVHVAKFVLRQGGSMKQAGKIYASTLSLVILFTVHSAYIHYHSYVGEALYNQIVVAGKDVKLVSDSKETQATLEDALSHLQKADSYGIYTPLSLNRELAAIYIFKKDMPAAKIQLQEMLTKNPKDIEARLRIAKLLYVDGKEQECSNELKLLLETNVNLSTFSHDKAIRSDALVTLGHIEEKNGFASSALNRYVEAEKENPKNGEALLALGVSYTNSGRAQEGEKYLLLCDSLTPHSAVILNNLSTIYLKTHQTEKAITKLNELVKIQPDNSQALYNLGMLFLKIGDKENSARVLKNAVDVNPSFLNAHIGFSMVLDSLGRKEESDQQKKIIQELKNKKGV